MRFQFKTAGIAALLLLSAHLALACDLCSYSVGLNPNFNQNQVGLRYRYRNFIGQHSHNDGHSHVHSPDRESFETFELWGRWCPSPKWRIQAILPYARNTAYSQDSILDQMHGLGDASVMALFQLLQKGDMDDDGLRQRLFAGLGGMAPTGKAKPEAGSAYDAMRQPGSGAWGLMPALSYLLRKGNWGLGADYNLRLTTTNYRDYRFSTRHNLNANLFYQLKKKEFSLLPFVGGYAEHARADQWMRLRQADTGGFATFGNAGFEAYWGGFSGTLMVQIPVVQVLNGNQGKNAPRITTGLYYSF
ncbi:MAG TPA: hypothetical protein VHS96_07760 [Bacteroidia bacterium]|nr:hypothetical protein [Bacteroidia bacterium]